jgi:hypothetical protein
LRNATEIQVSESTVLGCACGERIVLLGRLDDWRSEGRDSFECGACGTEVPVPELGVGRRKAADEAEEKPEDDPPWIGPRDEESDGSATPSVRKLIQELRAENTG